MLGRTLAPGRGCIHRSPGGARSPCVHRPVLAAAASEFAQAAPKKVVVVGGGWAGFGAMKHLTEQGYDVTLLDAAQNPGGVSAGWRTPQGRVVEAGMKGFWYEYQNIYRLLEELGIMDCLTDYLPSAFWGPGGELITEAPVFSQQLRLPAIIGQFFYTNPLMYKLPLADRMTIIPFIYNVLDLASTPESYDKYDKMTARELFRQAGVTQLAYENFLKPTLLVGLFANPEELSAAVVMETLYYYALAHQNSFDVRWCRGSISEKIFAPLVARIEAAGGNIRGGRLVSGLHTDEAGKVTSVVARNTASGEEEVYEADATVFAISIAGMQKLVATTPALAERREFRAIMRLQSIDCIATRLWFDRRVATRFPANVLAGFEQDVGATFFNLSDPTMQDEYKSEPGTVIAADFYGASTLLPLSDEAIVEKVHSNLTACEPGFAGARVVDSAVLRFPRAVTKFSPGSAQHRPQQLTSFGNVMMAGDWVAGVPHGANGLSQERAWVTGLAAANLVIAALGQGQPAEILQVEGDEPHIAAAKDLNSRVKMAAQGLGRVLGLPNPFL